jgi:hypothetical protein
MTDFPPSSVCPNGVCFCPWCEASLEEVTIRLEDLALAHAGDRLQREPDRDSLGQPMEEDALVAACNVCGRPFVIGLPWKFLGHHRPVLLRPVLLRPVRTSADVRYLTRGEPDPEQAR